MGERKQKGERLADTLARILPRIGTQPRERLAWLVRVVQRRPGELTAGDRENLRLELGSFIYADGPFRGIGTVSFREGRPVYTNWLPEEKVEPILRRLGEMVGTAVQREPVLIAKGWRAAYLWWREEEGRYEETPPGSLNWHERAARALANLLRDYGHLLRECPAPAVRAKDAEETCGTWFVAARPDQEYCSPTCRSRAGARAFRAGTETAAMAKRNGRKEGRR